MKILFDNSKRFDFDLIKLLNKRKKKIQSSSVSVSNIIKDIIRYGDKAVLKYEKKFNKNSIIIPSKKKINKSISSLDQNVKKAIDLAYDKL